MLRSDLLYQAMSSNGNVLEQWSFLFYISNIDIINFMLNFSAFYINKDYFIKLVSIIFFINYWNIVKRNKKVKHFANIFELSTKNPLNLVEMRWKLVFFHFSIYLQLVWKRQQEWIGSWSALWSIVCWRKFSWILRNLNEKILI